MPTSKRPTIRDVAQEAGVSKSLVSLVYSDESKVSPERKAAVLAAADKLGFTPNFWARSLASGASDFIGILVVDLQNLVYTELADAIRVELLKDGHETFMTAAIINDVAGVKTVEPSTVQALLDLRPRGIVVIGDLPDEKPLASVPETIPIIKVFTIPAKNKTRAVNLRSNDISGMKQIIDHLTKLGHKYIVYLGPIEGAVDQSRYDAYVLAMKESGLTPSLAPSDRSEQGGYVSAKSTIASDRKISALVCFNDVVAIGAQEAISESVTTGGRQIAVTGYDNTHLSQLKRISLTSVEQEKDAMASRVAQLLSEETQWQSVAGQDFQFNPTLVTRESSEISG